VGGSGGSCDQDGVMELGTARADAAWRECASVGCHLVSKVLVKSNGSLRISLCANSHSNRFSFSPVGLCVCVLLMALPCRRRPFWGSIDWRGLCGVGQPWAAVGLSGRTVPVGRGGWPRQAGGGGLARL